MGLPDMRRADDEIGRRLDTSAIERLRELNRDLKPKVKNIAQGDDFNIFLEEVAGVTGLEPATSGVTGRHSNQLSYTPAGPYRSARCLAGSAAFRVGER